MPKRFLTLDEKRNIQKMYRCGYSLRDIAHKIKCNHNTVFYWKNRDYTCSSKGHNRINKHERLIRQLYNIHQSSAKVRDILLKKGIKMASRTILSRVPLEIRKNNRRRTKNNPYLNTGIKASELDKDLISGLYLKYKSGMGVKLALAKQGIKASLSTIYKVIPKELKNKAQKK